MASWNIDQQMTLDKKNNKDVPGRFYIRLFSFYSLIALYMFVLFGSVYGLFVDEMTFFISH